LAKFLYIKKREFNKALKLGTRKKKLAILDLIFLKKTLNHINMRNTGNARNVIGKPKMQKLNQEQLKENGFQEKVYQIVKKIPSGRTMSYKEVAQSTDSPKAWRAVGNILHKNMDSEIPCHRVICSDGKIGGYNMGIEKKILLLKKEGALKSHKRP